MVSSGTVQGDLSQLQNTFNDYQSKTNNLDSYWKGSSHDNFLTQVEAFISEYRSTISSEMNAFASACDLYSQYINTKAQLSSTTLTEAEIGSINSKLVNLKTQINSNLEAAMATRLEGGSSSLYSYTSGAPLGIEAGTYSDSFMGSNAQRAIKYHAYVPEGATEGMPLIVYLHGDGSVNDFNHLKTSEMIAQVKSVYGDNFPFIALQPMTDEYSWTSDWKVDAVAELIQKTAETYHCDPNKIIISGGSRGCEGCWAVANKYPELFSACVPISGVGNINVQNFTDIPIVAFSTPSSSDNWNYSQMSAYVQQINQAGGNATFVSKSGYNHNNILSGAFDEQLFNWMIAQTKQT